MIKEAAHETNVARQRWLLRLYIAGMSVKASSAIGNIEEICEKYLQDRFQLQIIDILEDPEKAEADGVLAVPMLVRKAPLPIRRVIGDLSNKEMVMTVLELASPY